MDDLNTSELTALDDMLLLGVDLIYVAVGVALLLVAKLLQDWVTPFKIDEELRDRDNPALGVALCGYFIGVISIYIGAVLGDDLTRVPTFTTLLQTLGKDIGYAILGIVALGLGRVVVDKLILHKFSVRKEIIEDRNVGTGAIEAGALIATGLIIAGSINGQGGGLLTALVFFVLGQLVLVIYARFYDHMTTYNLHEEVECDNVAAGVSCGASLIAIGLIVAKATSGPFIGWAENLYQFATFTIVGFALLFVLRKVIDKIFLPGASLDHEIAADNNLSAAWIEGTISIGVAALVFALL